MRSKGCFLIACLLLFPLALHALEILRISNRLFQGEIGTFWAKGTPSLRASLGEEAIPLLPQGEIFLGIIAVDLAFPTGLTKIVLLDGSERAVVPLEVLPWPSKTIFLKVPEKFLYLSSDDVKKYIKERELLNEIFLSGWHDPPLWQKGFILPLKGKVSGEFGLRRKINGQYESTHTGIDISASSGTPVFATNDGIVVFSGSLLLEGNTVIIHHGLGLYSLYCHLERFLVGEREVVRRGDIVGTVGATGRATGPHLHWAIRFRNKRVSPLSLLNALGEK